MSGNSSVKLGDLLTAAYLQHAARCFVAVNECHMLERQPMGIDQASCFRKLEVSNEPR